MKTTRQAFVLLAMLSLGIACQKSASNPPAAKITIIQAAHNLTNVSVEFDGKQDTSINYQTPLVFTRQAGATTISVISDASNTVLNGSFSLSAGGNYSLYLISNGSGFDTLFMPEIFPVRKDSTAGIRVVNLTHSSGLLNVDVKGQPVGLVDSIGYKQITPFLSNPLTVSPGNFTFEVRDPQSGAILNTLSWSPVFFKNYTLVIVDSYDPSLPGSTDMFLVENG